MKISGVDHIAIAVSDTEKSLKLWRDGFGFTVRCSEIVNNGSVKLTHLDAGGVDIQLVEPLKEDHPVRKWINENGEGLHHLCLSAEFDRDPIGGVGKAGFVSAQDVPHEGVSGKRALFLKSETTGSVRVELTGY
jgi:methylmalonyl-CoA/ethylmalonyl-CoA epimerase